MDKPYFVEDIYPRHSLTGLTIRSPVAKGRLQSIECPKLPNTCSLITSADIPGDNRLKDSELPILAGDTLSYIGEPVALLLGPDRTMLEEYAERCKVIAEEETPVFEVHSIADDMVLARRDLRAGDTDAAFERAASIVRGDYSSGIQEHWYAEPVGAVAWLEQEDPRGGEKSGKRSGKTLVVHTATQWPFHVKRSVAQALKLEPALVRVESTVIGLHMDGKIWYPSLIACHAALGAWITEKPVRFILTREEDFHYSPKRNGAEISVSSALDERGEIIGAEINVTVNLGAYGVNSAEILDQTCLGSIGIYQFDNLKLSGVAVKTNIPPQGPFSGFGLAQGFFALEQHISHIADLRKQDPADWKKGYLSQYGSLSLGLSFKEPVAGEQLLDTAAAMSDYYRKWASYELLRQGRRQRLSDEGNPLWYNWTERGETLRGIGIALGCQGNGLLYPGADKGHYGIVLTLEKDGGLEIKTSMVSSGDDHGRVWAAMASEILSIDEDMVRIINNAASPDSGPATASRNITVLTKLVEQACLAIRKQRFRNPLPITVRKIARPQKNPQWEERFPPPAGSTLDAFSFSRPGWASAVVEVEIDPIEYIPRIRGVWMGVDGGKIFSEDRARRSLKVSTVQALGWAFREQISYTGGMLSQTQFSNYDIPSPGEIPPIHIDFIWNNTNEPKGIGDLPFCCVPAAYVHAVSQAMDHHFQSIPLRREDIWEAGKLKKTEVPQ
ncbi:MAG: molybdopterin-dependent oxidoreductase [Treponema sp.]|jgi:CO/xanthine dehydrogenase Mo-binding subunit|nr:molybdopterin-dependent oxidoreductase [Treponema sp.]